VFDDTLTNGGRVKAIVAPGMGGASRRDTDDLTETAKRFGAKGLVHLAVRFAESEDGSSQPEPRLIRDNAGKAPALKSGLAPADPW